MANEATRRLRIGAAGLGRAFSLMAPAFVNHPLSRLAAASDPRPEARDRFTTEHGAPAYASFDELCADPEVDAIYIATPHHLHAAQTETAARAGKHILVEKPMALSLDECRRMIEAAQKSGVRLLVGHSHSFDAPIARCRELVASGAYGSLRMISALNYTDFMYRPRRPEELDTARGGGVIFNQAPHQVDMLRLIGGGRLSTVRAAAGRWDPERPTEGAYIAFFTFASGAFASLVYSGYGHFDSDEFCGWIAESGRAKDPSAYGGARRILDAASWPDRELALKNARIYGGSQFGDDPTPRIAHQHFGLVVASCDRADLRPTPNGVDICEDASRRFETCPVSDVPRREVIDELYGAVVHGRPARHDGEWGLATMEACLAILRSAREGREIRLSEQCELCDG